MLLHVVRGTISDEKMLHEHFAHLRHRGEWFRRDGELLALIEKLKANNPSPIPDPFYARVGVR